MSLGSPAEGLAALSHQELTVGLEEGFLGKAKNTRLEPLLPKLLNVFLNRIWESLIAYNPGKPWRRLVLPKTIEGWSLTSLQWSLAKPDGGCRAGLRVNLLWPCGQTCMRSRAAVCRRSVGMGRRKRRPIARWFHQIQFHSSEIGNSKCILLGVGSGRSGR